MKKNNIIYGLMMCSLVSLCGCGGKSNQKDSQVATLKEVGALIASSGKASLPQEVQDDVIVASSYQQMVLVSASMAYTQGIYLEEDVYNAYNQIFKEDISDNSFWATYVKADDTQGIIDIYSLIPSYIEDKDHNLLPYDVYSYLHVNYDFSSHTLGDYYYTFSTINTILNQDDEIIGVETSFSDLALIHCKNGTLYYTAPQIVADYYNKVIDEDYDLLLNDFALKAKQFKEDAVNAKASSSNEGKNIENQLEEMSSHLASMYKVGKVIDFGVLQEKQIKQIIQDNASKRIEVNALMIKSNNGKITFKTKPSVIYLDSVDLLNNQYEIIEDDGQLYIQVTTYNADKTIFKIALYDYDHLNIVKTIDEKGKALETYTYYMGEDNGPITKDIFIQEINALKNEKIIFNEYGSSKAIFTIDGNNASWKTSNQYSIYYEGKYYEGTLTSNDKYNFQEVTSDNSLINKILTSYQTTLANLADQYHAYSWSYLEEFENQDAFMGSGSSLPVLYFDLNNSLISLTLSANNTSYQLDLDQTSDPNNIHVIDPNA